MSVFDNGRVVDLDIGEVKRRGAESDRPIVEAWLENHRADLIGCEHSEVGGTMPGCQVVVITMMVGHHDCCLRQFNVEPDAKSRRGVIRHGYEGGEVHRAGDTNEAHVLPTTGGGGSVQHGEECHWDCRRW